MSNNISSYNLFIKIFLIALLMAAMCIILGLIKRHAHAKLPLVNFSMNECIKSTQTLEELKKESESILKRGQETAKLYDLKPGETLKEITIALLNHPNTSDKVKTAIANHHRYFVFLYPSDGLMIKGYLSLPENTDNPVPLMILLRGGNRIFGLPHPGELSTQKGYSLVTSTNRGGVSEGEDEYGGEDVNDAKNLIDYLPTLEKKLKIHFHPTNKYLIGVSRGAMQLFLLLGRYPEYQQKIKKAVSISGLLNLAQALEDRPDFKEALQKNFGLPVNENAQAWINQREPINYISKLSHDLPIMLAQGTQDTRVCLKEGYDMLQALHDAGHKVTYVEIEGGDHVLGNSPDFIPLLMNWLEFDDLHSKRN